MQEQLAGTEVPVIAVGFSPPGALAALADHLAWRGAFLADEELALYRRLGFSRAPLWRVYAPGTLLFYARQRIRGRELHRPVDDPRQMGGDALVLDGRVVRRWRPRSPDGRVDPALLVAEAVALGDDRGIEEAP